ncbi:MAG: hypothetical protein KBC20_07475 [Oscillospiraceae bacterium]|nr:hypothetical protein [Oscillospiraceae bacterium]
MVKKRKAAINPADKATTAYGFQLVGCRISVAARAAVQKMEAAKKHREYLMIFFKEIPLSAGSVFFILSKAEPCLRHQAR